MLRLTLMLCAAIYAALVIYSDGAPAPGTPSPDVTRAHGGIDARAPQLLAAGDSVVTADGRILRIAARIDPLRLDDGSGLIHRVSTRTAERVSASASASVATGAPDLPLVEVTGSRVNLRAGPSTGEAVLVSLAGGARAELIAAPGNGWAQIRTLDGGVEGYMADRFLAPVN